MASREEMSTSFGAAAAVYESGRPDYPRAAVEWMLAPVASHERAPRVADVGAGTGKLTRVVAAVGAEVVAIDPDLGMLAELAVAVPGIPTFTGTAETLPLPDASVDAIVLGQAWHWVDPVAASAEVGRALRAGGVLGLVWNFRDEREPWVKRLTEIMNPSSAEEMLASGTPPVAAPFSGVEAEQWEWSRQVTREALLSMMRSRSYLITAPDDERARIEREVGELFDEIGAVGDRTVELPWVTRAYRAVRP
jgi:SAM-dependent methyltransferase